MAAAAFFKSDNLSDLNLQKATLYKLCHGDGYGKNKDGYPRNVVEAVLKEAKTKPVDAERVYEIDAELNPKPVPSDDEIAAASAKARAAADAKAAAADAAADEILDGPPPELPPPLPPPKPVPFALAQFNGAIKSLREVQTKSIRQFIGSDYTADDLRMVAAFLHAVADAALKAKTEAVS
jgi:hypothetical protein